MVLNVGFDEAALFLAGRVPVLVEGVRSRHVGVVVAPLALLFAGQLWLPLQ